MKTGRGAMNWQIQLSVPVPRRVVRRASEKALAAWLARALGETFKRVPVEFIVQSVKSLKAEAEKDGLRLVGPDGKEISSRGNRVLEM